MKSILLIGLGRFGKHIAEKLNELNFEILAIDKDEERVNDILPIVTNAQIGDSTNRAFLESLGVDNFDVCFVSIGDDFESSLITTAYLKELGAKKVISRASREVQRQFLLHNGADDVVYPEKNLAVWTAIRYTTDQIKDFLSLDDDMAIFHIQVPEKWDGMQVAQLDIRRKYNINILLLYNNDDITNKTVVIGDTVLKSNQTLLVLGNWKDIQECFNL